MTKESPLVFPREAVFILTLHGKLSMNKDDTLSSKTEDG